MQNNDNGFDCFKSVRKVILKYVFEANRKAVAVDNIRVFHQFDRLHSFPLIFMKLSVELKNLFNC